MLLADSVSLGRSLSVSIDLYFISTYVAAFALHSEEDN